SLPLFNEYVETEVGTPAVRFRMPLASFLATHIRIIVIRTVTWLRNTSSRAPFEHVPEHIVQSPGLGLNVAAGAVNGFPSSNINLPGASSGSPRVRRNERSATLA